jgi:hypothetical protein
MTMARAFPLEKGFPSRRCPSPLGKKPKKKGRAHDESHYRGLLRF